MHAVTTEGANVMEGTKMKNGELNTSRTDSPAASSSNKLSKKKNRERSASVSSHDSISDGSYTGIIEQFRLNIEKHLAVLIKGRENHANFL